MELGLGPKSSWCQHAPPHLSLQIAPRQLPSTQLICNLARSTLGQERHGDACTRPPSQPAPSASASLWLHHSRMAQAQFHLWRVFLIAGYLGAAWNVSGPAFSREQINRKPFISANKSHLGLPSTMAALTCVSLYNWHPKLEVQRVQSGSTCLETRFFPAGKGQV